MKPVLAFSMGDPAGIGPEVVVAALADARVRRTCVPVVVGCALALRSNGWRPGLAPLIDPGVECAVRPGRPTADGGRASFAAFRLALDLTVRGLAAGAVTAPISKQGWSAAGIAYRDHTEYLSEVFDSSRPAMMLTAGSLRAVLVTRHTALSGVPRQLTLRSVTEAARAAQAGLRKLGVARPRLGLCALNPHAGEGGLLGSEENRLLAPAVRKLRSSGIAVEGPLPADAAWVLHGRGRYDALIALYHDQALIPLKLTDPYGVVNWTVGLPVIRTSPGHGTAFDIAGKKKAKAEAMVRAALLAAKLASARRHFRSVS